MKRAHLVGLGILLTPIALVVLFVLLGIGVLILMLTSGAYHGLFPMRGVLVDAHALSASQKIYSFNPVEDSGVGNDPYLITVYQLRGGEATQLLSQLHVLKACIKHPTACPGQPTWRPRAALVTDNDYRLAAVEDELRSYHHTAALAAYRNMKNDPNSRCAAYNSTYSDNGYKTLNYLLLCVEPSRNILTYEYVPNFATLNI